jgi:hypothetical protein
MRLKVPALDSTSARAMREHREPWLKLPEKKAGGEDGRLDRRFRTHVVKTRDPDAEPLHALSAEPPGSLTRPLPASKLAGSVLPFRPAGAAEQKPVGSANIAEPSLKKPDPAPRPSPQPPRVPVEQNSGPAAPTTTRHPAPPKRTGVRTPGAPPLGLKDLSPVSSADWATKVGEAAKMVDVIVVFYSAEYLDSEMFQVAFQTVVNEVLPQIGRPYAAYRFSLDAEPSFVAEMAEALGLPRDNPVTNAGFAWSGPGRQLFIIGDRALESRAAFSRFLRRSLGAQQQAPLARESAASPRHLESFQRENRRARPERSRAPLLGRRALVIVAWCLFGSAALGAVVVGVAPQVANSILHSAKTPAPAAAVPSAQPAMNNTQASLSPPAANPDNLVSGPPGDEAQAVPPTKSAKPVHAHARRKHTQSWLGLNPMYWGLPSDGRPR